MMLQYLGTLVVCVAVLAAASHASPVAAGQTDRDHRQMKSDNGSGVHLPEVKIFDTQINQNGALSLSGAGGGQAGQISQMPFGGFQRMDGLVYQRYMQGYPGFSLGLQQQPQIQLQLQQQQLQQQQLQQQQLQQQQVQQLGLQQQPQMPQLQLHLQQQQLQQQQLQQQQLQQQQLQQQQLQQQQLQHFQGQQLQTNFPQQQQGGPLPLAGVGLANYNIAGYPTGSMYAGYTFAPDTAMGSYANNHIGTLDQLAAVQNHHVSNPSIVAGASVVHQQIVPIGPAQLVTGLFGPGVGPIQPLLRK